MQKLMRAKRLSKQELKSIQGGAVTCCRPVGGNQNPPKGGNGNNECGYEPPFCNTKEWELWQICVGPDYSYAFTCS